MGSGLTETISSIQGSVLSAGNSVPQRERFNAAAIVIGGIYSCQKRDQPAETFWLRIRTLGIRKSVSGVIIREQILKDSLVSRLDRARRSLNGGIPSKSRRKSQTIRRTYQPGSNWFRIAKNNLRTRGELMQKYASDRAELIKLWTLLLEEHRSCDSVKTSHVEAVSSQVSYL